MSLLEISQVIGNFGEFFGAIAVFATLAYLALQVRQGNNSINSANYFNAAISYNAVNTLAIGDAETAHMMFKGTNTPDQLTEEEHNRYTLLLRAYNNDFMAVWWSYRNGTFPEEQYRVYERNFVQLIASPGGRQLIPTLSYDYPDYAEFLQKLVDERGDTKWYSDRGYDSA